MSVKRAKVARIEQDILRQGVLLHDAQIAVLLDTLAAHRDVNELLLTELERHNVVSKEVAARLRETTTVMPEKYHRALQQLVEYRNKQYGGMKDGGDTENQDANGTAEAGQHVENRSPTHRAVG